MSTAETTGLPTGFEALEKYLGIWDLPTTQLRWDRRSVTSMEEIGAFYESMLEYAERALAYLDPLPIDRLPDDASRLLRLLLALANCAMAIEIHGQPTAPFSPMPHGVKVLRGAFPWG